MDESRGISASLRRLATRSLGVMTNRLELFLLELREEQGVVLKKGVPLGDWGALFNSVEEIASTTAQSPTPQATPS